MYKTVVLQLAAILIVAALVGFWMGERDAVSVLLGGAAYLVPNALFVVRLSATARSGQASGAAFFVGELLKILSTLVILMLAQKFYDVQWLAMLGGLFVALKANLFAFLLKN